ncbi:MAG: thioredoxin domain-containing protein [Patescibacteria group bacterium]
MNRERALILGLILLIFLGLSSFLVYRAVLTTRDTFKAGAPTVLLRNFTVPANIPLSQLRPPALYPADQMRFGSVTSVASIVLFGDYYCVNCKTLEKTISTLLPKYNGKVRYIWRDMVKDDGKALDAALFAYCAGLQGKFWSAHDALMNDRPSEFLISAIVSQLNLDRGATSDCRLNPSSKNLIKRDSDLAQSDGVTSTPILFVGTRAFGADVTSQQIQDELDAYLKL